MYLDKAALLKRTERRYKDVPLHDGSKVRLQSLTDLERMEWNQELFDEDGKPVAQNWKYQTAKLLVRTIVDGDGNRVFSDEDWELLLDIDSLDTDTLGDEAREHIGAVDRKAKKASMTGEPKLQPNCASAGE